MGAFSQNASVRLVLRVANDEAIQAWSISLANASPSGLRYELFTGVAFSVVWAGDLLENRPFGFWEGLVACVGPSLRQPGLLR